MTADVHNKISTISIQGMVRQIGGINFVQLDCATSKKKPTLLPGSNDPVRKLARRSAAQPSHVSVFSCTYAAACAVAAS